MNNQSNTSDKQNLEKICFVIMPISDANGYPIGHFKRVYDHLIEPACIEAGFIPIRADDIKGTNAIIIDILRRIVNSDMAICDLSSKNPNVLYELGVRQSFDLPVTFVKDELTDRIFDIQGFRDTPYPSSLRIDEVEIAITSIAANLRETYENKGKDINSIVELLGISRAEIKDPITLSSESTVLLDALNEIQEKLNELSQKQHIFPTAENRAVASTQSVWDNVDYLPMNANTLRVGDIVGHAKFGTGTVILLDEIGTKERKAVIKFETAGTKTLLLSFSKLKIKKDNII